MKNKKLNAHVKQFTEKDYAAFYQITIGWNPTDKVYVARVPELPVCISHGDTQLHALKNILQAIDLHLKIMKEDNLPLPIPSALKTYSGNFLVRMDPISHRDLAMMAKLEGKSLNEFVEDKLKAKI